MLNLTCKAAGFLNVNIAEDQPNFIVAANTVIVIEIRLIAQPYIKAILFFQLFSCIMHLQVFYKLMADSGRLNDTEMNMIFGNWKELLACNTRFQK